MQWSGVNTKTLTTSYVASDAIDISFAKRGTLFPYYTAGAGTTTNQVDFYFEINPLDSVTDPTNLYWSQLGIYTDSTGTWSKEAAHYVITQGTASTQLNCIPIFITQLDALQFRVQTKEVQNQATAGVIKFEFGKNSII